MALCRGYLLMEDQLKDYFSRFGPLLDVYLPKHKSGRNKGFGFTTFESEQDLDCALRVRVAKFAGERAVAQPTGTELLQTCLALAVEHALRALSCTQAQQAQSGCKPDDSTRSSCLPVSCAHVVVATLMQAAACSPPSTSSTAWKSRSTGQAPGQSTTHRCVCRPDCSEHWAPASLRSRRQGHCKPLHKSCSRT